MIIAQCTCATQMFLCNSYVLVSSLFMILKESELLAKNISYCYIQSYCSCILIIPCDFENHNTHRCSPSMWMLFLHVACVNYLHTFTACFVCAGSYYLHNFCVARFRHDILFLQPHEPGIKWTDVKGKKFRRFGPIQGPLQ